MKIEFLVCTWSFQADMDRAIYGFQEDMQFKQSLFISVQRKLKSLLHFVAILFSYLRKTLIYAEKSCKSEV